MVMVGTARSIGCVLLLLLLLAVLLLLLEVHSSLSVERLDISFCFFRQPTNVVVVLPSKLSIFHCST